MEQDTANLSSEDLIRRKLAYERARRETISDKFRDLSSLLVEYGYHKTQVASQADMLNITISVIGDLVKEGRRVTGTPVERPSKRHRASVDGAQLRRMAAAEVSNSQPSPSTAGKFPSSLSMSNLPPMAEDRPVHQLSQSQRSTYHTKNAEPGLGGLTERTGSTKSKAQRSKRMSLPLKLSSSITRPREFDSPSNSYSMSPSYAEQGDDKDNNQYMFTDDSSITPKSNLSARSEPNSGRQDPYAYHSAEVHSSYYGNFNEDFRDQMILESAEYYSSESGASWADL